MILARAFFSPPFPHSFAPPPDLGSDLASGKRGLFPLGTSLLRTEDGSRANYNSQHARSALVIVITLELSGAVIGQIAETPSKRCVRDSGRGRVSRKCSYRTVLYCIACHPLRPPQGRRRAVSIHLVVACGKSSSSQTEKGRKGLLD